MIKEGDFARLIIGHMGVNEPVITRAICRVVSIKGGTAYLEWVKRSSFRKKFPLNKLIKVEPEELI